MPLSTEILISTTEVTVTINSMKQVLQKIASISEPETTTGAPKIEEQNE